MFFQKSVRCLVGGFLSSLKNLFQDANQLHFLKNSMVIFNFFYVYMCMYVCDK